MSTSDGKCCQIRTGVLFLGFFLGTFELSMWVMYYTFRQGFRESIGHPIDGDGGGDSEGGASAASTAGDEDLIAACIIVAVDLFANALLICGANKDYSGRRKDLRRWGFMVPWVLVYGCNILGLFAGSIVAFYQMQGGMKSIGVVPLCWGTFILMGHILVMFFIFEQRADHDIYLAQQAIEDREAAAASAAAASGVS